MTLVYHSGQLAVQDEANTRRLADNLADWVGPVAAITCDADMLLFATRDAAGRLEHTVLSGPRPMAHAAGPSTFDIAFPAGTMPPEGRAGVLAINLSIARRARINGWLSHTAAGLRLEADETFTLCRKYMAPSVGLGDAIIAGPAARESLALDDASIAALLDRAECTFLASASPEGHPDVAHRGGPPGFVKYDAPTRTLAWAELLGDGVFKSAGNVRASRYLTLLVPDFDSGDGIELVCDDASYTNYRTSRRERLDPLIEDSMPYPVQGQIAAVVVEARRLRRLLHPRQPIERALKVTSCSTVDEQAPQ